MFAQTYLTYGTKLDDWSFYYYRADPEFQLYTINGFTLKEDSLSIEKEVQQRSQVESLRTMGKWSAHYIASDTSCQVLSLQESSQIENWVFLPYLECSCQIHFPQRRNTSKMSPQPCRWWIISTDATFQDYRYSLANYMRNILTSY